MTSTKHNKRTVAELRATIGAIQNRSKGGLTPAAAPAAPLALQGDGPTVPGWWEQAIAGGYTLAPMTNAVTGARTAARISFTPNAGTWRRLVWAVNKELGDILSDVEKATIVNRPGFSPFHDLAGDPNVPTNLVRPLTVEKVAVDKLAAIADRAYAFASGLDALLDVYLEERDSMLEQLDEADDGDGGNLTEAVTPAGWLSIGCAGTTKDGDVLYTRDWHN